MSEHKELLVIMLLVLTFSLILIGATMRIPTLLGEAGRITGLPTGVATVEVLAAVQISLPVNTVDFGTISTGATNNTTDNSPPPFTIQNDGTVRVNVTIARDPSSTPMFNGTGGGDNSASFQFKNDQAIEGICAIPGCSVISWANVPGTTPLDSICFLNYTDSCDIVETDLLIDVPSDEPAGLKNETLVFTASQA